MSYVTKQQIESARQPDLLTFLQCYRQMTWPLPGMARSSSKATIA